jgi:hypothetical protein
VTEEGLELPHIPERDGHEAVSIKDLKEIYVNSIHGGILCFMVTLDLAAWILDGGKEAAEAHGLIIERGTRVVIHDYINGATGGEGFLSRDLVLAPRSFEVRCDQGKRHGIQACCDYAKEAWRGSIRPVVPPPDPEETFKRFREAPFLDSRPVNPKAFTTARQEFLEAGGDPTSLTGRAIAYMALSLLANTQLGILEIPEEYRKHWPGKESLDLLWEWETLNKEINPKCKIPN